MPTIALVDDDRNILTSVSMALEAEGYRIMTYTDGASALDGFKTSPPDLAILDIKMPPPRMTTLPGATPGTPPSRMPRPPAGRSRYCAPTCTLMRPATSLIGVSRGREQSCSRMVS